MFLMQRFTEHVIHGVKAREAMAYSIADASLELSKMITSGFRLETALQYIGVGNSDEVADRIYQAVKDYSVRGYYRTREPSPIICRIVLTGGGVQGVPTPECIESHLPEGRKPTAEEIKEAWEACKE